MRQLRKLACLPWCERRLLLDALVLLGAIRLGLWLLPFRKLLKLLTKATQSKVKSQQFSVSKIVWAVNAASRCMPGVKCLARAFTCQLLMSHNNYSYSLRIGVTKGEKDNLEAHAWIEHRGRVVIGNLPDLYKFIPLPSLEGVKL
ncbi:MAG: lasso peptide biosynthesis B2 protein [Scytonematopsis contorta HA4267-MV1]|jgi:hypothetical protein|nr:lasso peptide biosynthesis B2 protein [Scytonematopsis contorta HA4267-MV1]